MVIYVVKSGDTLWRIANQYGVTINQIVETNQLENPDELVIGQALVIPTMSEDIHTVVPGESLWAISRRYGVSVNDIASENGIQNPDMIYVGQLLRIPKPMIEANGYLVLTGVSGQQRIRALGKYLTYVSMFSYRIQADGVLAPLQNDEMILEEARRLNVTPLMTITNIDDTFSPELAHTVLESPGIQEKLLTNIVNVMGSKGYRGLNIDFEYVLQSDRELYNQFLRRAADRMHANGFSISTALAPKVSADQQGLLYEAHDYPVHGQLTDFVVLMTYEWGWAGGPPLAIAPINSVRRVLDYAVTVIPRSKILMGIPLYGRDWKLPYVRGVSRASTLNEKEAIRRAARYGAIIKYNEQYQSPFYNYIDESGVQHEVWYEDARSYQAKYNTIKEYGLRGASFWSLTLGMPQNWPVLENNFRIRKL